MTVGDIVIYLADPLVGTGIIVDILENGWLRVAFDTDDAYIDTFHALELELAAVWEKTP